MSVVFIGEAVVGIIEGVAGVVQLIAESLGFAAGHLSEKPREGQPRFSGRRVLIAFLPFVGVISVLAGLFLYWDYLDDRHAAERDQTKRRVEQLVTQLAAGRDPNGRLHRIGQDQIDVVDAWGRPLRVAYEQHALYDVVTAWSVGHDGQDQTWDDVKSRRNVFLPKVAGRAAVEKVGDALKKRLQHRDE